MNISLLSLGSLLSLALYKDGADFDVVKTSLDPAVIATDIVNKANTQIGGSWLSVGSNVVNVGSLVSYTYEKMKWFGAMNRTLELTGGNYYWYINEAGEFYFREYPASPTHKINLLKNVNEIMVENNSELILNESTVYNTALSYNATNASSITNFFKRDEWQENPSLDAIAAQNYVNGRVADNANPKINVSVELNETYNLESLRPGQTCSFFGLEIGSTLLGNNMKIVSVEYDQTTARLVLSEEQGSFGNELTKYLSNQLQSKKIYS